MKAVATHAPVVHRRRQRERLRESGRALMERGVEAGHLRQLGPPFGDDADGQQVVRLVQRRQRHQLGERVERGRVEAHWRGVLGAAVHHPVTDRDQLHIADVRLQPIEQELQGTSVCWRRLLSPRMFADDLAARIPGAKPGSAIELLQVAADACFERLTLAEQELSELEAGRASVENENCVAHVSAPFPPARAVRRDHRRDGARGEAALHGIGAAGEGSRQRLRRRELALEIFTGFGVHCRASWLLIN